MRLGGFQLEWLRRRWWIVALSVVAVSTVALIVQPPTSTTYTGEALLLVRSGATDNTPGNANGANQLAVTYAGLIPHDSQVLERVARALNASRASVEKHVVVVNDPGTSILRARYTDDDAQVAVNGARAIADALAGSPPASSNFNGVGLSALPDKATASSSTNGTLPVGILLGLCLGIVLVIALERNDGRIDDANDLEDEVNCPTTSLASISSAGVVALLERWRALALDLPAQVAIVAPTKGHGSLTADVALVFAATASSDATVSESGERSLKGLTLLSAGTPGTDEVGEAIIQHVDLTVLVVPEGTRITELRSCLRALADFGVTPGWALFASENVAQRAKRRHKDAEPVVIDIRSALEPLRQ